MKSESSQSQSLLLDLSSQLQLDSSTRSTAEIYLTEFKSHDLLWDESKSRSIVRCAILAAYKSSKKRGADHDLPLSLQSLLSGASSPDIHTFIRKLKEFLKAIQINDRANLDIQAIINSYAFSLTLYSKFEEVWEKVRIIRDDSKRIKDFVWVLFILARINILQRRCDIVECACMLLGTFQVVLSMISKEFVGLQGDMMGFLCGMIKAAPEQVKLAGDHLRMMVEKFKEHNHIRGNFANSGNIEGVLDQGHLVFNLKSLSSEYMNKLLPDDIDERDFLLKETSVSSPLKIKDSTLNNSQRFCNQRVLDYEDDESLSMSSRLQDIKFPTLVSNSPYSIKTFPPCSRMTTSLELETWLNSHIETSPSSVPTEILEKLDSAGSDFITTLTAGFKDILQSSLSGFSKIQSIGFKSYLQIPSSSQVTPEGIMKLFFKVLLELLKNEEKQQELRSDSKEQMSNVLKNETFYRALLVCCLETVLYANNITALDFSEVLEICGVSAFDTWKLMKNYLEFDSRIPTTLRQHFKGLEARVISNMAWTENSPIAAHIRHHLGSKKDLNHPAILMFCRRVLAYCALRIYDLANLLVLNDEIREEIWTVMKNALSEETDLFINREMDQIIICTMYGVCKAKSLNVTFNNLITKYTEFYSDNGRLFRSVRIEGTTTGDIIRFYNEVYVKYMKNYLMALTSKPGSVIRNEPRIPSLNPASPLKYSLPPPMISYSPSESRNCLSSPLRSPYVTPRSKRLYAFGESPSYHLDAINSMMNKTSHFLSFEEDKTVTPTKRPKLNDSMYDDGYGIEDSQLEFEDFKGGN